MAALAHAAPWRVARGWSGAELERHLRGLAELPRTAPRSVRDAEGSAWRHKFSTSVIALEPPGKPTPGGPFERARALVERYAFSEPRIATGHFDAEQPLLGRYMLLELKPLVVHYLCGVVVGAVRDEPSAEQTVFGFRYDTLLGHIEAGWEWFLLTKAHATGCVEFRIEAAWRPGQFPNAWSRIGFLALGRRYQRAWHRRAHERLRIMLGSRDLPPLERGHGLLHEGRPRIEALSATAAASPLGDTNFTELER